jgi:hypothetical protein
MGGQDDQTGTESSECTREYVKECQSECLAETVMTGLPRDYGYSSGVVAPLPGQEDRSG